VLLVGTAAEAAGLDSDHLGKTGPHIDLTGQTAIADLLRCYRLCHLLHRQRLRERCTLLTFDRGCPLSSGYLVPRIRSAQSRSRTSLQHRSKKTVLSARAFQSFPMIIAGRWTNHDDMKWKLRKTLALGQGPE